MTTKQRSGGAWWGVIAVGVACTLGGAWAVARGEAVERAGAVERATAPTTANKRTERPTACTHLVFVIETSAAMREARSGRLAPAVFQTVVAQLAAQPELRAVQMFDAEGRRMLGARDEWQECGLDLLVGIERVLARYAPSTVPNPVAGISDALGRLPRPLEAGARVQVCVIGESLVSQGESVLCRLDELNPVEASGRRRAVISAVQVAGTSGSRARGAATGTQSGERPAGGGAQAGFQDLMREVARQHGGTFRALGGAGER